MCTIKTVISVSDVFHLAVLRSLLALAQLELYYLKTWASVGRATYYERWLTLQVQVLVTGARRLRLLTCGK